MENEKRTRYLRIIKNFLMIILGSAIDAFGIDAFIKANHLALGGFSGLGLLLNYSFNIPIGVFIFRKYLYKINPKSHNTKFKKLKSSFL